MSIEAYPLCWPHGKPRTKRTQRAAFNTSFAKARDMLIREIDLLGGRQPIISSNIPLRLDGLPYAGQKEPEDSGVAVYFTYKGDQHCFACDRWNRVVDNIQAIRKTIEALRGIARWGTGDMMERAFTGFAQLPDPSNVTPGNSWWDVLGVTPIADSADVRAAYQRRRKETHPDHGGDPDEFARVQQAWEQYKGQSE